MKSAIITGGAQGLGRAMAEKLLEDGFRVEVWDLKVADTDLSDNFRMRKVDVSSATDVQRAADAAVQAWGLPDALINNAGITRDRMLHKMSLEDFEATWKVNVVGTFLPTQILGSKMREEAAARQKAGQAAHPRRILMLSSIAGVYGNVGQANYASSKAAVIGFMKTVAKEWGRYGISALAIAPGMMNTEMTQSIPAEILSGFVDRTPLRRMGDPRELAALVANLCRPESHFLTGDVISFSGGLLL